MADRLFYVECPEFRSHPSTYGQALALQAAIEEEPGRTCFYDHEVKERVSLAHLLLTEPPPIEAPQHDDGDVEHSQPA